MTGVPDPVTPASVAGEFAASGVYLDSATMGLPPRRTLDVLEAALADWRHGVADARAYDDDVAGARAAYAGLVGVPASWVAIGHQASPYVGLVASQVPDGAEVLLAEGDFTSVSFPFLAQVGRGVRVREVPLERLAESVTSRTHLVAVSAVQSSDGRVADLDALVTACAGTGTQTLVDLTQSAGWLPVDASRVDYTVAAAYKWLLAPRGSAFMTVRPERLETLVPHHAGWYAGQERWSSIYGSPLRLAADARRFDVSPAWQTWIATRASLSLLTEVGPAALHAHAVGLANRFRAGVGLEPGESAILSLAADESVPRLLAEHGIKAAGRAGRLRLSFHVNNSVDDVERAVAVLRGHVTP